ncbi:trypsin-like peptidase domain-containing protein [Fimbriiglobus ruber]|uniref:Serine protease MucD/AlgY associated with sigma factor RpoE n=1 Tax=Fimbriiglobus ruber TaxID=1908690 RepID=A0A225DQQ1_9BACT|nr:trypsin-like peptidase domain-containing protein [Fimbriiglobus ruber]OWK43423.1 Serine protease precursor MucD/AlgY associated with sigma factor RpoE [Fimbriiglobus ruber]
MRLPLLALALAPVLVAPAAAQDVAAGTKVYKQTVPSVVWIHSTRTRALATGSGTLIDRERRLVLTNYHVVEDNPRATVYFPQFRDGQPISDRQYYEERKERLGRSGRVVALDKKADLALIRVDGIPDEVKAIPLAAASPDPGEPVHSIGNAGKSGALWGYVKGTVRQVYRKKWQVELERNHRITFEAKVIETDSPTNPGDSGGPLLNDKGELVGVTQGGAVNAQLVSFFVDISEVKRLLRDHSSEPTHTATAGPKREAPPPVSDKAKLFSADAVKAAEQTVTDLFKKDLDVLIETYPVAPSDWVEKARKGTADERQKMFREWMGERIKAEKVQGVIVLICLDPRHLSVDITAAEKGKFPEKYAQKIADAIRKGLTDKKPDDGLAAALKLIQDGYTGGKK